MHFDSKKAIIIETNSDDELSAGMLSQYDATGLLLPVVFYSKKHPSAECSYGIYDKELLDFIRCLEECCPLLESTGHQVQLLSDHGNLEYFMTSKLLNRHHTCWFEFLSRFNFKIKYPPHKQGEKPDPVTRRTGGLPEEGHESQLDQSQVILKRLNLDRKVPMLAGSLSNEPPEWAPAFEDPWTQGSTTDKFVTDLLKMLEQGRLQSKTISLAKCTNCRGQIRYWGALYVPDFDPLKLALLNLHHDVRHAGHPGWACTFDLICWEFYKPTMRQ